MTPFFSGIFGFCAHILFVFVLVFAITTGFTWFPVSIAICGGGLAVGIIACNPQEFKVVLIIVVIIGIIAAYMATDCVFFRDDGSESDNTEDNDDS